MSVVHILPKEVEKAFGPEGSEKFVLFLNDAFDSQKTDVIQTVTDRFEKHVTGEASKVRLEVAELRTELKTEIADVRADMSEFRTELKGDMADLKTELKGDMADLKTELKGDIGKLDNKISDLRAEFKSDISEVHKSIADVQKGIAIQTRWILVALLGGAVIYPIAIKLIDRLLP